MSGQVTAADWSGERGEKWRASLSGIEAMLQPIDDPLLRALQLDAPCTIAEVGCGGGGTTLEILRRAPAGSIVHGFDVAPGLVEVARGRVRPGEQAIAFEVADMATATPRRPYDRLVSRFGVMFFSDPQAAFANLLRWLAPGGRFAFAVWGPQEFNPWIASVREVVAGIIELPPVDPHAPGPFRYADGASLLALLDRAGFTGLEVCDWRAALSIGGGLPPAEAANFAISAFSTFGELLAAAGGDRLDEARRSLAARFSAEQRDGVVRMGAHVRLVTGTRP